MATMPTGLTPPLEVFDLPTSLSFYRDVLGFRLLEGDDSWWCMLQWGGATLMLNTAYERDERPLQPEPPRVRGHADTSLYFDADPDEICALLKSQDWPATAPTLTSYGMWLTSTHDPDGF